MTSLETIRQQLESKLTDAGLSKFVQWDQSQFRDLGEQAFVELVLNDASHFREVNAILSQVAVRGMLEEAPQFSFSLRAIWKLKGVGTPQVARTPDGKVVAATVVPVILQSAETEQEVSVLVTYDAGKNFSRILGREPDFAEIARVLVEGRLKRGGASAWNPMQQPRLEVTALMAGDLSRQLPRAA